MPELHLEPILDEYAIKKVRNLTPRNVIESLHKQGITSLEQLVEERLADFQRPGNVAKTTFIYDHFIYKESRALHEDLLDLIEAKIRRPR